MIFDGVGGRYICPGKDKVENAYQTWVPTEYLVERLDSKWSAHYSNGACSKSERSDMLTLELRIYHFRSFLKGYCYGKYKASKARKSK